ncbi:ABC transporter permease [Phyllobacterium endophyticum]|uniref:ABC transporter permease n=1 Tax=Phyllobacterium endophyticum TaxID=1149773 RepID=UPI0011C99B72|nr:ABC transporter permease [Phyllobacterium endophyticum]TXR47496.1 ABC transporter permease [Phyllobacterium endophyticum]
MSVATTEKAAGTPATPAIAPHLLQLVIYGAAPIILLLLWQIAASSGYLPGYLLPSPVQVFYAFIDSIKDGSLLQNLATSTVRSVVGFVIAMVIAVPAGIAIGWFKYVRKATALPLLLLVPIPITAWISIAILWFGLGDRSAIFLVALGAAVPILINTIHGVEWVDRIYVDAARVLGTGRSQILWRIVLPAALPNILTGARLGLRNSWAGLVVAEMIGAQSGIGYMIWDARLMLRSDLLVLGMFMVGILGSISDQLMHLVMRHLLRWHGGNSRED